MSNNINNIVLKKFKNKHCGETVYFFGSGPTIKKIDLNKINPDFKRIGVNQQIFIDEINLDYWFQGDACKQDMTRFYDRFDLYNDYKPNIQKFVRYCDWKHKVPDKKYKQHTVNQNGQTPLGMKNTIYYMAKQLSSDHKKRNDPGFYKEIHEPSHINAHCSITFEVLQFILYFGFKNIYLIGHDCNYDKGTFDGCKVGQGLNMNLNLGKKWPTVIDWISNNYSDVSITWVNPTREVEKIIKDSKGKKIINKVFI